MPSRNGSPVTAFNAVVGPVVGTAGFCGGGKSPAPALKIYLIVKDQRVLYHALLRNATGVARGNAEMRKMG